MFREGEVLRCFREEIIPGCGHTRQSGSGWRLCTGEEVYSVSIILKEEGLQERSRIYATDMNEAASPSQGPGHTR